MISPFIPQSAMKSIIAVLLAVLTVSLCALAVSATLTDSTSPFVDDQHDPANAALQFQVHPELEIELFAAEPFLVNPTNIDVDHLGRIWVAEVVNYRQALGRVKIPERQAGDRILILSDTDGDAKCDKQEVFYQGRDIDSVHGICVLGDRVLVSARDQVFYLIDTDGDLKADKKELLFTKIGGVDHDHGVHAFVFGPDGKLYFNFGNHGHQICDANGEPIVDRAGNVVNDQRQPYQQGMVFRCDMDGSNFETLGWNFRNNWEVAVDSFGTMWQSDNDDDGNKGTRINYIMPFGNYGFRDEMTGAGWRAQRTGMHAEIPKRHWHLNDPGVIPNVLQTGAGSPTGICVYEGDALPKVFHNQMIHCDAGPSVVRAYPTKKSGAGYTAEIVSIMDASENNQWFRPSDVCVAPDGSLIVADWYDPGVGGHLMGDGQRGRLFRVTSKGQQTAYKIDPPDFSKPESAVEALMSPNLATRFLAWQALQLMNDRAIVSLLPTARNDRNPRHRARALWAIGKMATEKKSKLAAIEIALADENPDLRVQGIRMFRQQHPGIEFEQVENLLDFDDPAAEVRRELLILLADCKLDRKAQLWAKLANQYPAGDRWYLEALGIAARNDWDECLKAWLGADLGGADSKLATAAGRDIVWRARGSLASRLLAKAITSESDIEKLPRYFRAFDFQTSDKENVLLSLAFESSFESDKHEYVMSESLKRMDLQSLSVANRKKAVQFIGSQQGTPLFLKLVRRIGDESHMDSVLAMAHDRTKPQLAVDALKLLYDKRETSRVEKLMSSADDETAEALMQTMADSNHRKSANLLWTFAMQRNSATLANQPRFTRQQLAIKYNGQIQRGAQAMLQSLNKQGSDFNPALKPAIIAALHNSRHEQIRSEINRLHPIPSTKDNSPLPSSFALTKEQGSPERGLAVFTGVGTCAKCHQVNGKYTNVGPDLSEIGSKLSRQAMFESILFPSAGISHDYESWKVVTVDGALITGLLLSETDSQVVIVDSNGIQHTIEAADIEAKKRQELSLMPADLQRLMSQQELVDVVEYMTTLRKK